MAKMEKKSVAQLLAVKPKKPSIEEIEQITQNIHTQKHAYTEGVVAAAKVAEPTIAAKKTAAPQALAQEMDDLEGRIKRISVHAPLPIYIKAKTKSTIQGVSMMAYILQLMENDLG